MSAPTAIRTRQINSEAVRTCQDLPVYRLQRPVRRSARQINAADPHGFISAPAGNTAPPSNISDETSHPLVQRRCRGRNRLTRLAAPPTPRDRPPHGLRVRRPQSPKLPSASALVSHL